MRRECVAQRPLALREVSALTECPSTAAIVQLAEVSGALHMLKGILDGLMVVILSGVVVWIVMSFIDRKKQ